MKFYIAGPMNNRPWCNFPAFDAAASFLRRSGHEVVNPADHDRDNGFDEGLCPNGTREEQARAVLHGTFDIADALLWDHEQIAKHCQAVVVLPGWEHSAGANSEVALARALGKPVYDVLEFVPAFHDQHRELLRLRNQAFLG